MPHGCFKTFYCNKYHRLTDGVPLNHGCRILDPRFLLAEKEDDHDAMMRVWEENPTIVLHDGEASDEPLDGDSEPPRFRIISS